MNQNQRGVLIVAAAAIAAMVVYPPYVVTNYSHVVIKAGYSLIWNLPPYVSDSRSIPACVNGQTLIVQIVGALVVAGLLFFALKTK